jgi:hypothetical protein
MGMRTLPLPVLVVRWFRDGVGYAYSPEIDARFRTDLVGILTPVSRSSENDEFQIPLPDGRILLGKKLTDTAPLDPQAAHRGAYVIRAAVCPSDISPRDQKQVREQLMQLPLPDREGENSGMVVHMRLPTLPPPVPLEPNWAANLWVYVAAIAAIDVVLQLPDWPNEWVGPLIRIGSLAALTLAAVLLRGPLASSEQIGRWEWEWYEDAEPSADTAIRIAQGAWIVGAGGTQFQENFQRPMKECGIARPAYSEVDYRHVDVRPRSVTLMGVETVLDNGQSRRLSFTRMYAFEEGRWWLKYAQWTAIS